MNTSTDKITVISTTGLVAIGAALIALALGGCGSKDTETKTEPGVAAKELPRTPHSRPRPSLPDQPDLGARDDEDRPRRDRPRLDGQKWNNPDMAARREEMMKKRAEMVQQYDKNGDGELDDEERTQMREARLAETFTTLDADGDGKISRDEAEGTEDGSRGLRRFDRIDADGDGFVSEEEMKNSRMGRPGRGMRGDGERRRGDRERERNDDTDTEQ
jgi:Ca2+-binding EF-hand superfamily protein